MIKHFVTIKYTAVFVYLYLWLLREQKSISVVLIVVGVRAAHLVGGARFVLVQYNNGCIQYNNFVC